MPLSTLQPHQLLYYVATNRVLICKECRYAIQPSAISRHLKDLHHIYRSDRQELVNYTQSLDLAKPEDVVLPEPHEAPIPFLPVVDVLICGASRCDHLCISLKRMKSHWVTAHRGLVVEPHVAQWRPVQLQTFFRGNQLRYFIISGSSAPASQPQRKAYLDCECSNREIGTPKALVNDSPGWSADDLGLFENFKTSTYFDLGYNSGTRKLWQTVIP